MQFRDKITPEGTKDLLFEECDRRHSATQKLKNLFTMQGYRRIMTPALEYYDVFARVADYFPLDTMFKLTDNKGRLLVLCPDCTIPAARLTAARLKDEPRPLRLYYNHNIYRMDPQQKGRAVETNQVGVELIGGETLRSDLEVVELGADCMEAIAGEKYRLELCHIGYFKAIIESLQVEEEIKERIRGYIEQKNYAALTSILEPYKKNRAARALLKLPRLFGGAEVIDKAYQLFDENGAGESLDYLKKVYEYLQTLGLGNKVIIDLGLVNLADYYTGIIFRGYFTGIGEQVLSGGRYDNLLGDFGEDSPSVGFGINVDLASRKIKEVSSDKTRILVFAENTDYAAKASAYRKELNRQGIIASNSVLGTREEVIDYAKASGIPQVHMVGEEIKIWRAEEL